MYISPLPQSGAKGLERLANSKYYYVLKRQIIFNLGLQLSLSPFRPGSENGRCSAPFDFIRESQSTFLSECKSIYKHRRKHIKV